MMVCQAWAPAHTLRNDWAQGRYHTDAQLYPSKISRPSSVAQPVEAQPQTTFKGGLLSPQVSQGLPGVGAALSSIPPLQGIPKL